MLFGGETAQSYYEEGLTAAIKGDMDQAIRYFQRANELDAGLHQAQYQIGRCLLRQGKAQAALPLLEAATRNLQGLIPPRLDLGFAFLHLRHTEAARGVFSEILRENPEEPRAILGLAYCAFSKGHWETTINLVQHTIELGRVQFDTHFLLARAADKANMPDVSTIHYQKAEELMNQSIEATPEQPAGYYLRGRVYFGLGQRKAALEDVEMALKYVLPNRRYYAYNEIFSREEISSLKESILAGPPPESKTPDSTNGPSSRNQPNSNNHNPTEREGR